MDVIVISLILLQRNIKILAERHVPWHNSVPAQLCAMARFGVSDILEEAVKQTTFHAC